MQAVYVWPAGAALLLSAGLAAARVFGRLPGKAHSEARSDAV
jgi:hypothetical protein